MATIEKRVNKNGKKSYRVKVRKVGHKSATKTCSTAREAKDWGQDTETSMRSNKYDIEAEAKKHTLGAAIDRYIKNVLPLKPKSGAATKTRLLWWKAEIGSKKLADVTSCLIGEKRDKLLNEPIVFKKYKDTEKEIITTKPRKPGTVNRYLAALSVVYTEAVKEWKWLTREQNPMPDVTKPREPKGRVRCLSDEERGSLLARCKASFNVFIYPIVVVALSTGMRLGEVLRLTWADVDFKRRRLIIQASKNGERRSVPLVGHAFDELKRLSEICLKVNLCPSAKIDIPQSIPGTQLIFPRMAGPKKPKADPTKPVTIRYAWEKARADIMDFRFHDLRHSAASYLAMNGATLAEIAEILGHKDLRQTERYTHLTELHTQKVVEDMNQEIFKSAQSENPDPEVVEKAASAKYKIEILRQVDACTGPGTVGALLRQEGLYFSNITAWRRQRDEGTLSALTPKQS